jgi:hypothetical protein
VDLPVPVPDAHRHAGRHGHADGQRHAGAHRHADRHRRVFVAGQHDADPDPDADPDAHAHADRHEPGHVADAHGQ